MLLILTLPVMFQRSDSFSVLPILFQGHKSKITITRRHKSHTTAPLNGFLLCLFRVQVRFTIANLYVWIEGKSVRVTKKESRSTATAKGKEHVEKVSPT